MHETAVEVGDVEPIVVDTNRAGQTVEIRICRHSDGFWLDWSDDTFKIIGSVVTLDQVLTAKDATNAPGVYQLASVSHPAGLDTSILGLSATVDDSLLVITNVTAGPASGSTNVPTSELRLLCLIDGLVKRKTVHSRTNAMAHGKVELSGAAAKPSQVAVYYQEDGSTVSYKNDNTGDERNPTP